MKTIKLKHPVFQSIKQAAQESNVPAYIVGGYVRDAILGNPSKDIDFVVEGDGPQFAEHVARILGTSDVTVYKKFGTAMVRYRDLVLEFVGARKESYRDHSRKPDVENTDLLTDLSRRDFTVNAMAVSLNPDDFGEIIDPYNGRHDIRKKVIKTPLEPERTFYDDPLRIMRAVRFATRLGFHVDEVTRSGLHSEAERLRIISQERITDELLKIMACEKPSIGFQLMDETGILPIILPEVNELKGVDQVGKHSHKDVFNHTLKVIDNLAGVTDDMGLRLTGLFHDIAKPATKQFRPGTGWTFHGHDEIGARMIVKIFRRLKLSNDLASYVEHLTRMHLRPIQLAEEGVTDSAIRRLIFDAGDAIDDLITFCRADITSANPKRVAEHLGNFDFVVKRIGEVEEKDRLRQFQPPVRGNEIMETLGLQQGKQVGIIKKAIEEAILNGDIPNEHDAAFEYMFKIKDSLL